MGEGYRMTSYWDNWLVPCNKSRGGEADNSLCTCVCLYVTDTHMSLVSLESTLVSLLNQPLCTLRFKKGATSWSALNLNVTLMGQFYCFAKYVWFSGSNVNIISLDFFVYEIYILSSHKNVMFILPPKCQTLCFKTLDYKPIGDITVLLLMQWVHGLLK